MSSRKLAEQAVVRPRESEVPAFLIYRKMLRVLRQMRPEAREVLAGLLDTASPDRLELRRLLRLRNQLNPELRRAAGSLLFAHAGRLAREARANMQAPHM